MACLQVIFIPLRILSFLKGIFRDQIKFQDILARKNVTVSLVDHHILSKIDEILHDSVIHVFDHRPIDPDMKWDSKKVMVKIEEVGSCASLISDIILKHDLQILCYELAYLLYGIFFDNLCNTYVTNKDYSNHYV